MKTRELCWATGITDIRLAYLIRSGKLKPPEKDCSGDYRWPPGSVEELRKALAIDLRKRAHRRSNPEAARA